MSSLPISTHSVSIKQKLDIQTYPEHITDPLQTILRGVNVPKFVNCDTPRPGTLTLRSKGVKIQYHNSIETDCIMITIFGYWRCSTDAQDQERQIRALKDAGCEKIVGDKITGTSNYGDRDSLSKLLEDIKAGDLLILDELNRLGRTMVTMLVEVNRLLEKGVKIKTLDGGLDTTTMPSEIINLIVGVMGYAAEMELKNIKRRTAEGRAVALSRGVKMGRKRSYSVHQLEEIKAMRGSDRGYGSIAKSLGMSKSTVQRLCVREGI